MLTGNHQASCETHIDECRENFADSEKYDVLCFCEAKFCDVDQLPNGIQGQDIRISGFHDPIVQKPHRASNRGRGLAIYVNVKVCDVYNFEKVDIPLDP